MDRKWTKLVNGQKLGNIGLCIMDSGQNWFMDEKWTKSEYKSNRKESKMWTEIYKKWTKNGQMIDRC